MTDMHEHRKAPCICRVVLTCRCPVYYSNSLDRFAGYAGVLLISRAYNAGHEGSELTTWTCNSRRIYTALYIAYVVAYRTVGMERPNEQQSFIAVTWSSDVVSLS